MAKTFKECPECGYSSEGLKESVCPVCGATMVKTSKRVCNPDIEKQFNNGYHNDFEEQRKTGSYCDEKFEKYVNGGEHYHNKDVLFNDIRTSILNNKSPGTDKETLDNKLMGLILGCFFGFVTSVISPFLIFIICIFSKKMKIKNKKYLILGIIIGFIIAVLTLVVQFLKELF